MINNVLPFGLKLSLNLALGVNDSNLVYNIERILDLASSRILETVVLFLENEEEVLDNNLENMKQEAENELGNRNFIRNFTQIKRNVAGKKQALDEKLNTKLRSLIVQNVRPENFSSQVVQDESILSFIEREKAAIVH